MRTYPDGVIGVVVGALGEIQGFQSGRVVRTAALVVSIYSATVPLEVGYISQWVYVNERLLMTAQAALTDWGQGAVDWNVLVIDTKTVALCICDLIYMSARYA